MNSSVRSKHMDLLRENCESEDLLKGEEPQPQLKDDQSDIKECSHGRRAGGRRRGVKVNGWERGRATGVSSLNANWIWRILAKSNVCGVSKETTVQQSSRSKS